MLFRLLAATLLLASSALASSQDASPKTTRPFDAGWRFHRGDVAGAQGAALLDRDWSAVDLPHDWAIAGPFDEHAPATGSGGWLPTGVAWYRKHFALARRPGRRVFVQFDGVMERSGVWINGHHLGFRPSGYASFRYELTPFLSAAGDNVLSVRADTSAQPASRWYAGGGIYRHVRLIETGDIHVDADGTFVSTPRATADAATVAVRSTLANQSATDRTAHLEVTLLGPDRRPVATMRGPALRLPAGRTADLSADATLARPHLWDVRDPALHTALVRVVADDGTLLDQDTQAFGIRDARFDAASGFLLNGRPVKLKGVAIHADGGAFGMAVPLSFTERRLRGLQALGVNSIRTAHHPFSPEFLDLCDRLGLLVMDEAFDQWTVAKNPEDYHLFFTDWSSLDVATVVRRDRNHPSVVIWSAGNEIHDTAYPLIAKSILERLLAVFHREDPTRPVTQALFRPNTTHDYQNGLADMLDVVGQNYRENELHQAHIDKPTRRIVGTENSKNRESWLVVRDDPAYAGMFLWTGVDYLGEADRIGWPAISNPAGLADRTDRVKPIGWERASWWSDAPVVRLARRVAPVVDIAELPNAVAVAMPQPRGPGLLADWSPADRSPHIETVEVYGNTPEVELFLGNRSLGRKPRAADDTPRRWSVPFAPGTLRAVGYQGTRRVAEDRLVTAGPPVAIRLIPETRSLGHGFDRVGFVRVEVVDAKGTLVPDADQPVTIAVTGGTLAAFDNGSITDHTPFASPTRAVDGGHALAMVRAGEGATVQVRATAHGLRPASASIAIKN